MGDFFHGWRRKAGLVLLTLALGFFGLWCRSHLIVDELSSRFNDGFKFYAEHGQIRVHRTYGLLTPSYVKKAEWRWETHQISKIHFNEKPPAEMMPRCKLPGLTFAIDQNTKSPRLLCTVSLLWFVLPLTLLSAFLLLIKPRKTIAKKPYEPESGEEV
jgi:hypothetical protein